MYQTALILREIDGRDDFWAVSEPLVWETPVLRIVVPRGALTDLASIPRALRNILDPNGKSRKAAVTHDWNYRTHLLTKAQCDQLLYDCLIAEGESKAVAWMYKAGVMIGGASAYSDHPIGPQPFDFDTPENFTAWKKAA